MPRVALLCVLGLWGCSSLTVVDDGTSLAYGWHNAGRLVNGVRLPLRGDGYVVPPTWAQRGNNYGTDELVSLIVRVGRRLAAEGVAAPLYVADLSPARGGASEYHRSHQTGRDVDLLFFARDERGRPARPPSQMPTFAADGFTAGPVGNRRVFDVPGTWALVRALTEDPEVMVQFLFISAPLEDMLIAHAVRAGEPAELVARASALMQQPGDSLPYNDHLHVRIYCPPSDRSLGCRERGPLRWGKKTYKYWSAEDKLYPWLAESLLRAVRPFCQLMGSGTLARR